MKRILGSSSPFRRQLLEAAGVAFEVVPPGIDEKKIRASDPLLTPLLLSYAKAEAVAKKVGGEAIIIACDQVILCAGELLEKPESADEIRRWHQLYAEHPVQFVNGFTVVNTATGTRFSAQEISTATFAPIPSDFTEAQIAEGAIFNCAGAIGSATVDTFATITEGSRASIIGLPVAFVMEMVERVR